MQKKRLRVRESQVLQTLEMQFQQQQQLFQRLEADNRRLKHQHDLLQSLCNSLEKIIQQKGQERHCHSDDEVQAVAAAEQELMQQLGRIPLLSRTNSDSDNNCSNTLASGSGSSTALASRDEPVAPLGQNMLYLFSRLVLLPPAPAAGHITLQELRCAYALTVQELSLSLHLYTASVASGDGPGPTAPLERIADVMAGHLHLLASLSQAQRGQLISLFLLSNNETGELLPAVNQQHHKWAVGQVALSEQQKRHIAAGLPVFERLLAAVHKELRPLQEQGLAALGGSGTQQDDAAARLPDWKMHAVLLDREQQRAMRLELLLQKEYLLRGCAACYVYGCMSWAQIARLHCLMWPFSPAPAVLVQLLHEELQGQQGGAG